MEKLPKERAAECPELSASHGVRDKWRPSEDSTSSNKEPRSISLPCLVIFD